MKNLVKERASIWKLLVTYQSFTTQFGELEPYLKTIFIINHINPTMSCAVKNILTF